VGGDSPNLAQASGAARRRNLRRHWEATIRVRRATQSRLHTHANIARKNKAILKSPDESNPAYNVTPDSAHCTP
jgi:hypothetical protein